MSPSLKSPFPVLSPRKKTSHSSAVRGLIVNT